MKIEGDSNGHVGKGKCSRKSEKEWSWGFREKNAAGEYFLELAEAYDLAIVNRYK